MAQELELSDYATIHDLGKTGTNGRDTKQSGATPTERRLLRIGILTLGVLCIIQAILNISLHLAFNSKEDTDQFPLNSSVIADMCQMDQSQQKSTQLCSCCNNLLRRLVREYQALKTERNIQDKIIQLLRNETSENGCFENSGSGYL